MDTSQMKKLTVIITLFTFVSLSIAKPKSKNTKIPANYLAGTRASFLFKVDKTCIAAERELAGSGWRVQCSAESMQKNRHYVAGYYAKGTSAEAFAKLEKIKSIKVAQLLR